MIAFAAPGKVTVPCPIDVQCQADLHEEISRESTGLAKLLDLLLHTRYPVESRSWNDEMRSVL